MGKNKEVVEMKPANEEITKVLLFLSFLLSSRKRFKMKPTNKEGK